MSRSESNLEHHLGIQRTPVDPKSELGDAGFDTIDSFPRGKHGCHSPTQ